MSYEAEKNLDFGIVHDFDRKFLCSVPAEPNLETEWRISYLEPNYYWFFSMFYLVNPSSWFELIAVVLLGKAIIIRLITLHDSWEDNHPVLVIKVCWLQKSAEKQAQIQEDFSSFSVCSKTLFDISWNCL